jgi:hypothetical protein
MIYALYAVNFLLKMIAIFVIGFTHCLYGKATQEHSVL